MRKDLDLINALFADRVFVALEERLRGAGFNVFDVLRIQDHEIRHSNVLAWLFDPEGAHGLGDQFLKAALESLLPALKGCMPDMRAAEVYTELENIDIVVDANEIVVAIENKIYHSEAEGQLVRYEGKLRQLFPRAKQYVCVLLSLAGEPVRDKDAKGNWKTWSHKQVSHLLKEVQRGISPECRQFVEHYRSTLKELTMEHDQEFIMECRRLYGKHRRALDLLHRHGRMTVKAECQSALKQVGEFRVFRSASFWCGFVPKEVLGDPESPLPRWEHFPASFVIGYANRGERSFGFGVAVRVAEGDKTKALPFEQAFGRQVVWDRKWGFYWLALRGDELEYSECSEKACELGGNWIRESRPLFAKFSGAFKEAISVTTLTGGTQWTFR